MKGNMLVCDSKKNLIYKVNVEVMFIRELIKKMPPDVQIVRVALFNEIDNVYEVYHWKKGKGWSKNVITVSPAHNQMAEEMMCVFCGNPTKFYFPD